MNRLNKAESAVFLYSRFSLFLEDPFSRLFRILDIECVFLSAIRMRTGVTCNYFVYISGNDSLRLT